jgi:hypothetical protein
MIKHNQDGAVSGVAISLVLCVLLLLGAIGFGAWAFTSRQDYKNNSDQKAAAASEVARKNEAVVQEKHFAEEYKKPFDTYNGPEATGSLHIEYPKTWSSYVVDSSIGGTSQTLEGYFAPGTVPSVDDKGSVFSLRVSVLGQAYSTVVSAFSTQQKAGKLQVSAYSLPKLPKVVGVRVVGQLQQDQSVDMVVLPLRSQTLEIWTEGSQYANDFNSYILPNFSFAP